MKRKPLMAATAAFWLMTGTPMTAGADDSPTGARSLAITVYGNGLALVVERRSIDFHPGFNELSFEEISPAIDADSFRLSTDGDFQVREQTFLPANLTRQALLRASLGETVEIARRGPDGDTISTVPAEVLAVEPEIVVRIGGRIEANSRGRFSFGSVPARLRPRPVMRVRGRGDTGGTMVVGIRYLTGGLSWRAEHVADLNAAAIELDLDTRASVTNATGVDFPEARLRLVAGDVNRTPALRPPEKQMLRRQTMAIAADGAPETGPSRQSIGGYHVYGLPGSITLASGLTAQVSLIKRIRVPVERELISVGHPNAFGPSGRAVPEHPVIRITLTNDAVTAEPIPGGRIRFFGKARNGEPIFLGEDRLPDLPAGGRATLSAGRAFDVTMRRQRTDMVRQGLGRNTVEFAYRMEVRNGSDKAEKVSVIEAFAGDWKILTESLPHQRKDGRALWEVSVPPGGGTVEMAYRARVRR